jgi:outer membrane protein assembly factor BamB
MTAVRERTLRSAASPPAVGGECVVYLSADGAIVARSHRSGRRRWELKVGSARSTRRARPAPVISGGVVCVRSGRELLGVELDSGRELWRAGGVGSAPVVAEGIVLAADAAGHCCAFGAARGGLQWSADLDGERLEGAPVAVDGTAYVPGHGGIVHALGLDDGKERWPAVAGTRPPALALAGDTLLASCGERLLAIDRRSGERGWRRRAAGAAGTGIAAADGAVVSSGERSVCCAAIADGELRWTRPLARTAGAPVIAGDLVLLASPPALHGVSLRDGAERWTVPLAARPVAAPVLTDDGCALVTLANGTIEVWRLP